MLDKSPACAGRPVCRTWQCRTAGRSAVPDSAAPPAGLPYLAVPDRRPVCRTWRCRTAGRSAVPDSAAPPAGLPYLAVPDRRPVCRTWRCRTAGRSAVPFVEHGDHVPDVVLQPVPLGGRRGLTGRRLHRLHLLRLTLPAAPHPMVTHHHTYAQHNTYNASTRTRVG